jgi:hypothetical protein
LPALTVLLAVFATACSLVAQPPATPIIRGGWAWPVPAPLPPGAVAVPIDVASPPRRVPPDVEIVGCPLLPLGPVTPEYRPGREPPVTYKVEGEDVRVRWPVGFSARLAPNFEIVAPDGKVIARAGEATAGLSGGHVTNDDVFSVCMGEYGPTRVGP